MLKIGYFVPEFPGQTHGWCWREMTALKARGVEPDLVSTRRPPPGIVSHGWSREAMERTTYLAPPTARDLGAATRELARAAPAGLARCATSMARAEGLGTTGRLRLAALAVMGGRLASLARARGWEHIHAHSCGDTAHVAMFAHLISGIPYSLTLHARLSDFGANQREKWSHARFAVIITATLREQVRPQLDGCWPDHIEIAPVGVDTASFDREAPYEPWTGKGPLRIFSCGRLNPAKGHQELIDAMALLSEEGIDAELSIAGEDEGGGKGYRRVLEAQIAALKLGERVRLLGAISEEGVRGALAGAHIFSLASHHEGLGISIAEAMAMRVPVVVTAVGGIPELVETGVEGVLVPAERPQELAQAILAVARDPALAARLGEGGRRKVESSYDSSRSAEALVRGLSYSFA